MDRMITESLKEMYGLKERELYPYLALRYLILESKTFYQETSSCEIAKFILSELNISIHDNIFVYQKENYDINREARYIIESLKQRASDYIEANQKEGLNSFLRNKMDHLREVALKEKANKYPRKDVSTYYKYFGLMEVNNMFKTKVKESVAIEGIEYCENHNPFKRTQEEQLELTINSIEMRTTQLHYLSENALEDYLMSNLGNIEEGLKPILRQLILPEGRIDILATDKDGKFVVIELKVEEDKDILWQSLYYPEEIGKKYGEDNVRMIVIAPKYSISLKRMLENISKAELYTYTPLIEYGRVINLKTRKI